MTIFSKEKWDARHSLSGIWRRQKEHRWLKKTDIKINYFAHNDSLLVATNPAMMLAVPWSNIPSWKV